MKRARVTFENELQQQNHENVAAMWTLWIAMSENFQILFLEKYFQIIFLNSHQFLCSSSEIFIQDSGIKAINSFYND